MERYYKSTIKVEVLSNEPITTQFSILDLKDLEYEVTEGHASGVARAVSIEELTKEECADALKDQGSDPGFLIMDDDIFEEEKSE